MSVFYELLEQTTKLEQVEELDDLFSTTMSDGKLNMEIWGLKPDHNFPIKCNARNFNYIGYIGLSKLLGRVDIRYVEFFHENKGCDGIIDPFIDMVINRLSKDKKNDIILVPRSINTNTNDLWTKYLSRYFNDIDSGEKFLLRNNIPYHKLEWSELMKTLPSKPGNENRDLDNMMSD